MLSQSNNTPKKENQNNDWEILQSEIQGSPLNLKSRNNVTNYFDKNDLEKIEEKASIEEDSRFLSSKKKVYSVQKLNNIRINLLKIFKYKNKLYFYWKKWKRIVKKPKTKKIIKKHKSNNNTIKKKKVKKKNYN